MTIPHIDRELRRYPFLAGAFWHNACLWIRHQANPSLVLLLTGDSPVLRSIPQGACLQVKILPRLNSPGLFTSHLLPRQVALFFYNRLLVIQPEDEIDRHQQPNQSEQEGYGQPKGPSTEL